MKNLDKQVNLEEAKRKNKQEIHEAQTELIRKLNKNVNEMNKKLEKNKVNMVTDFIEK